MPGGSSKAARKIKSSDASHEINPLESGSQQNQDFMRLLKTQDTREKIQPSSELDSTDDESEGRIFTLNDWNDLSKKISDLPPYKDTTDAILLIDDVRQNEDKAAKKGVPLPFSELEWHCIRLAAEHRYKGQPEQIASTLSNFYNRDEITIRHIDISNPHTVATTYHYATNGHPEAIEGIDSPEDLKKMNTDNEQSFGKESEACYSLLTTPNGRSIPYLFEQHKDSFGLRETKK